VNGRRLTGRDYKRTRRTGLGVDISRLRELAIGFGAGLCIAGVVYVADHHTPEVPAASQRPTPRHAAGFDGVGGDPAVAAETSVIAPPGAEGKYDFYQMLPKFEVVVPEKERGTRVAPAATIDRPGIYFLQVGSYRDEAVADRIHAQLAKLGIDSTVQRVAVDADVWHRVRIGPIKDLPRLNRLRQQLSASDLDSLVIRVDE
jgi:cell division septation protein DedD